VNVAIVCGRLSSQPRVSELGSGDVLVRLEVTAPPRDDRPAESVPVSWIGPARRAPAVGAGDEVVVVGRVRRRFFRAAGGGSGSATDLTADEVVPATRRAAARRAVEQAWSAAEEALAT
jgi:hypothetical protein